MRLDEGIFGRATDLVQFHMAGLELIVLLSIMLAELLTFIVALFNQQPVLLLLLLRLISLGNPLLQLLDGLITRQCQ